MNIPDKLKNANLVLTTGVVVYVLGSALDIYTTIVGLEGGYRETSIIVRTLIEQLGLKSGVIASKMVAIPIALYISYAISSDGIRSYNPDMKQSTGLILVVLGLYYLGAGIRNYIILT
jgi:uncharacterized membrane protein